MARLVLPSISFKGSGFLGCYQIGVADCLIRNGLLLSPGELPSNDKQSVLCSASAGSIVAMTVSAGVKVDDLMTTWLDSVEQVRNKGKLGCFYPGFSLVDHIQELMTKLVDDAVDGDDEYFLRRIDNGRLLRIYLTNHRWFFHHSLCSYRYIDTYRGYKDAIAAAVLSSYIPAVSGPILGASCIWNHAVRNAWKRVKELGDSGAVKDNGGKVVDFAQEFLSFSRKREIYWDGGFTDILPIMNQRTVVVSPLTEDYSPNPIIAPTNVKHDFLCLSNSLKTKRISTWLKNIQILPRLFLSSDDHFIVNTFRNGYDDARRFLDSNNMLKFHLHPASSI